MFLFFSYINFFFIDISVPLKQAVKIFNKTPSAILDFPLDTAFWLVLIGIEFWFAYHIFKRINEIIYKKWFKSEKVKDTENE